MTAIEQSESSKLYPLLLLANDVLQRSKDQVRMQYVAEYANYLPAAFNLSVQRSITQFTQIERLLNIWQERQIYSANFMTRIRTTITETSKKIPVPPPPSVKPITSNPPTTSSITSTVDYSAAPSFDDDDEDDIKYSNDVGNNLLGEATESIPSNHHTHSSTTSLSSLSTSTSPTISQRQSSINSPTTTSEDITIENLLNGSLANAIQDSHRRFRIGLGLQPLLTKNQLYTEIHSLLSSPTTDTLPQRIKQLVNSTETNEKAITEINERLTEVDATEKIALFSLAYAQMNHRRREAIIGKLVESIVVSETRIATIETEMEENKKLELIFQELNNAAQAGKTVRVRKTFGTLSNHTQPSLSAVSSSTLSTSATSLVSPTTTNDSVGVLSSGEENRITDYDEEDANIGTFEYTLPTSSADTNEETYETNDYTNINQNDDENEEEETSTRGERYQPINAINNYYDPTQETVSVQARDRHLQRTSGYYDIHPSPATSNTKTTIITSSSKGMGDVATLLGGGNRTKKRTRTSGYSGFVTDTNEEIQVEEDEDDEYVLALQGSSTMRYDDEDNEGDDDNTKEPKTKRPAFVFDINAAAQGALDNTEWDPVRQMYVPLNAPDANESWREN